jgi:molybdopterin/thiamine biosynthesis adenylyltransferase
VEAGACLAWIGAVALNLDFDRIRYLISPESLADKVALQVGLGSGGAPVCDHLTMNGVRRWILYDPEPLEAVNLIKHPRRRADIGKLKVQIQKDWIIDRNPEAEVTSRPEDVFQSEKLRGDISISDLILSCTDKRDVRLFLNSLAIEFNKPCVTASVYRQGFGGEVYAYIPGTSGCFECMERFADSAGINVDSTAELTGEEQDRIYGLSLKEFRASGLSIDIQTISALQARAALDILLSSATLRPAPLPCNWLIHYNRPTSDGSAGHHLKTVKLKVKARKDCRCARTSH